MKKKQKMLLGIVLGLLAAALGVGFHFFRQHRAFEAEMVRVVHSQEVKEQIESSFWKSLNDEIRGDKK